MAIRENIPVARPQVHGEGGAGAPHSRGQSGPERPLRGGAQVSSSAEGSQEMLVSKGGVITDTQLEEAPGEERRGEQGLSHLSQPCT